MKKIIVISNFNVKMNAYPNVKRLDMDWIFYRIDIFMRYTCKSFLNQTNQNFDYLLTYDPISYDLISKALSKYPKLPDNIRFIKNELLVSEISNLIKGYDYFYSVRIDADDMFHPTFIQQLHTYITQSSTEVLINQHGYIYDIETNQLANWFYYSPPFYTLIYKVGDYIDGKRYMLPGGHKDAFKLNYEILDRINFVVISHGKNTATKFNSVFNKGLISNTEIKNNILNEFNIL